jgi:quercetin dioxygenase-like cupin family protein
MPETIQVGPMTLTFLRSRHDTGGALDMFEMIAQPNARMPVPHYHRDWEETVYGLSGTLTFSVDGTPHEIGPGDSAFVPRGIVHGFNNFGTEPARVLCVLTPGMLGPEYFREIGAELATGAPPDPAKLGAIMARYGLIPAPPK